MTVLQPRVLLTNFASSTRDWKYRALAESHSSMTTTDSGRTDAVLLVATGVPCRDIQELRSEARINGYTVNVVRLNEALVAQHMSTAARQWDELLDGESDDDTVDAADDNIWLGLKETMSELYPGNIYAVVLTEDWARQNLPQTVGCNPPKGDGLSDALREKLESVFLESVQGEYSNGCRVYTHDRGRMTERTSALYCIA